MEVDYLGNNSNRPQIKHNNQLDYLDSNHQVKLQQDFLDSRHLPRQLVVDYLVVHNLLNSNKQLHHYLDNNRASNRTSNKHHYLDSKHHNHHNNSNNLNSNNRMLEYLLFIQLLKINKNKKKYLICLRDINH